MNGDHTIAALIVAQRMQESFDALDRAAKATHAELAAARLKAIRAHQKARTEASAALKSLLDGGSQ